MVNLNEKLIELGFNKEQATSLCNTVERAKKMFCDISSDGIAEEIMYEAAKSRLEGGETHQEIADGQIL